MKPYPSYKNSVVNWVVEIPRGWTLIKPKYILNKRKRDFTDEDEIVTCFRDGVVTLRKNRREDGFTQSIKEIGYQRIHKGDLVIHEMDGFAGSIGVSDSFGKSTPVYTVISESDKYEVRYWMYLLREMSKTGFIESLAKSIRQRTTEFRWKMWRDLYFPIPSLSEQCQIVNYLDTKTQQIDTLIEKKQKQIELLKLLRAAIINQAVTKGLNPDVKMKDSGIEWLGNIPEHWEVRRVATFGTFSKGCGIRKDEIKTSGIPCIRYGEIYTEYERIVYNTVSFINEESSKNSELVKNGDVLFTGSGETIDEIGKTVVYYGYDDIFIGGDVIILKLKDNLRPLFISYLMNSNYVNHQKSRMGKGEIVVHIYSSQLKDIKTALPPIPEQHQIVEYLDEQTQKIDSTIEKETQRIELLKEYRQSLISEAVTGKIDVRDEVVV